MQLIMEQEKKHQTENFTFFKSLKESSADKGCFNDSTGSIFICERQRAEMLGMRIRCSVSVLPSTLAQKLLSISSGNGSRAPNSPSKSELAAMGRTRLVLVRGAFGEGKEKVARFVRWGIE